MAEGAEIAVARQLPALTTIRKYADPLPSHDGFIGSSTLPIAAITAAPLQVPHLRDPTLLSYFHNTSSTAHRPPNIYLHGGLHNPCILQIADVILHWLPCPVLLPQRLHGPAIYRVRFTQGTMIPSGGCLGKARRPLTYSRKSFVQS